ncbi:uncharacterized protein BDCG_00969 [Blastomyces dermatitidis ER-3]|uniref:Uncharacterized protein n=1 Tax=Ajellomyces dermatitidis (strain ER-3 / ATCC MYA-2586) TaxID=559297 RepID=A0ABP2EMF1_AJEDR|nr:uncharacterized protein BDCG_00969 [Blastomyces dermatitidis ER-3]EEQ84164.2 hypothetical protein BDCG_00969 [Blastomyces dermatitidis ER-3]
MGDEAEQSNFQTFAQCCPQPPVKARTKRATTCDHSWSGDGELFSLSLRNSPHAAPEKKAVISKTATTARNKGRKKTGDRAGPRDPKVCLMRGFPFVGFSAVAENCSAEQYNIASSAACILDAFVRGGRNWAEQQPAAESPEARQRAATTQYERDTFVIWYCAAELARVQKDGAINLAPVYLFLYSSYQTSLVIHSTIAKGNSATQHACFIFRSPEVYISTPCNHLLALRPLSSSLSQKVIHYSPYSAKWKLGRLNRLDHSRSRSHGMKSTWLKRSNDEECLEDATASKLFSVHAMAISNEFNPYEAQKIGIWFQPDVVD